MQFCGNKRINGGVYFHSANLGILYIPKLISVSNYLRLLVLKLLVLKLLVLKLLVLKLLVQIFLGEELFCRLIGEEEGGI